MKCAKGKSAKSLNDADACTSCIRGKYQAQNEASTYGCTSCGTGKYGIIVY